MKLPVLDKPRILITAGLLALFSVVGVGLVALTHEATNAKIAANAVAVLRGQIVAVLPPDSFTQNPASTAFLPEDPGALNLPALKNPPASPAAKLAAATEAGIVGFRAIKDGQVTAVVLPVITHYGYSGDIKLIVGVARDGQVTGVRVTRQNETPGLGDKIEPEKSPWIFGFNGKSLGNPDEKGWAVKKDGGIFDQFSGATITPRAVVGAIHAVLHYVAAHHEQLFAAPVAGGEGSP
ncbi:RnfABCDGE type electron transport complex subunit G [Halothiobacillus sp. DCM-1]|uniref:RnfABCDGE type electron transport complex subunit G n=1 Tax=Halothiobacillus sp. DCM-1 TaxID=3112558 RepID=UPI003248748C